MNGQERNQAQRQRGKDKPKPEGGQKQEQRQNRVLDKFKKELASRDFADDEIMRLTKDLGESLVKSQRAQLKGDVKEHVKTQIRKFYHLVRAIEKSAPGTLKVRIRTLQAQIAYAVARRTVSEDFKDFFDVSLEKILRSKDDLALKNSLSDFGRFFEAFYAYFYYQIEIDRSQQGGQGGKQGGKKK